MRLSTRQQILGLVVVVLVASTGAAPLPAPSPANTKENSIEAYEDGLLIFVPTIPAADKNKSGKDLKREVEYELIAIPGEVLRREIRQIARQYQLPSVSSGPSLIVEGDVQDFGEIIVPSAPSTFYGTPQVSHKPTISLPTKPGISLPTLPAKPAISLPSLPAKPAISIPVPVIDFDVSSKPDFGQVIAGVTGQAAEYVGGAGETLVEVGAAGTQVLGQVGASAATNGANIARWLLEQKTRGISTATQVVGGGLQFAGQLSAGVLRALLQVPGIKARVLTEILEAGEPLVYAVSDVIAESADDLGDVFEAKTAILSDALSLIIRLVQETLSLKGRIIHSLSTSGLDIGATAFNAGVRIGGALVSTAANVGEAVVDGVSDIVEAGKSVDLPPLPALPPLSLPTLPVVTLPKIDIPDVDLSRLIPSKPVLAPLPLPAKPQISFQTVDINVNKPGVGVPLPTLPTPGVPLPTLSKPSIPTQLYNTPGR